LGYQSLENRADVIGVLVRKHNWWEPVIETPHSSQRHALVCLHRRFHVFVRKRLEASSQFVDPSNIIAMVLTKLDKTLRGPSLRNDMCISKRRNGHTEFLLSFKCCLSNTALPLLLNMYLHATAWAEIVLAGQPYSDRCPSRKINSSNVGGCER